MKTPTWATTIGIIMIVLGACSVRNDLKSISLPEDLALAKSIIQKQRREAKERKEKDASTKKIDSLSTQADSLKAKIDEESEPDSDDSISFGGRKEPVEKIMELTPFTKKWIVNFGYIGLFASVLYILGGVFMLVKRNFSIKLAYAVLAISILTSGAQAGFLTSSSSSGVIALSMGLSQLGGIVIDIVILAVIFSSDKEAYNIPKA